MKRRTVKIDNLARVEGEGGLYLQAREGRVTKVQLRIFEPPRFFEAFLRGRGYAEVPDITARICGICPVAYQMSSVHAIEDALGIAVGGTLRALRRLLYCGEWIESHVLSIFLLHAPDFLGYPDAIAMAKDHGEVVRRALKLKKAGNDLLGLLGGRPIHPINVRVGGFYSVPSRGDLTRMGEELKWARDTALEMVRWLAALEFPDFERDYVFVALRADGEYPFNEGRIVSNKGLNIAVREFENHFLEQHVPYSTALHSTLKDNGPYFAGPLARYNLNFDRLSALAQEAAREAGLDSTCRNPFKSILVRGVEVLYACDEALRIIGEYEPPPKPAADLTVRTGTGHGCTEAPRGLLYHRYHLGERGTVLDAKIVPPTSQNQATIEEDLREYATRFLEESEDTLRRGCEQAIRNYDPCISCSTHFLKLRLDRA
jgi:sulfhydrogenase subunit alpha